VHSQFFDVQVLPDSGVGDAKFWILPEQGGASEVPLGALPCDLDEQQKLPDACSLHRPIGVAAGHFATCDISNANRPLDVDGGSYDVVDRSLEHL
jgi:hypothetical protein